MSFTGAERFTVRGHLQERAVSVTYDHGRLEGDDDAVARVRQVLDQHSTMQLTPPDDEHPATLDDPHAVMAAIQEAIAIDDVEGDYPIPDADDSAS